LIPDYSRRRNVFIAIPETIKSENLLHCHRDLPARIRAVVSMLIRRVITGGAPGHSLRRYACGDPAGSLDTDPFEAAAFPGNQLDMAAWYPEVFCEEPDQVAVCLAVNGRRSQPDFQTFAVSAVNRVDRGPGLEMDVEHQVFSIPGMPRRGHRPLSSLAGSPCSCQRQVLQRGSDAADSISSGGFKP
jgi:hypothetical protein